MIQSDFEDKIDKRWLWGFYILLALSLIPWFFIQLHQAINTDLAFLTQSALRMLAGEAMSQAYYDTNPPLSIIVYVPAALIMKYFGISVYYATYYYSLILLALGIVMMHWSLKTLPSLSIFRHHLILSVFVISNTLTAQAFFGEKDQYIVLFLAPFLLVQLSFTLQTNSKIPTWQRNIILFLGAFFIMLKPHYYILPAAILAHRIWLKKYISCLKQADTFILCLMTILYMVIIAVFFPDFLTVILPDILSYYIGRVDPASSIITMLGAFIGLYLIAQTWSLSKENRTLPLFFFILYLCSLAIVTIQGKGYYYHYLPAIVFLSLGLSLFFYTAFMQFSLVKIHKEHKNLIALFVIPLIFVSTYYPYLTWPKVTLTHEEYKNMPLTQIVNECRLSDSFFMFNDSNEIVHQIAAYSGKIHASRFPVLWHIPVLLNNPHNQLSQDEIDQKAHILGNAIAEDFEKYHPCILILGQFPKAKGKDVFDFIDYFSQHSLKFKKMIQNYSYEKTIEINQIDYFPNTSIAKLMAEYNIYYLRDEK